MPAPSAINPLRILSPPMRLGCMTTKGTFVASSAQTPMTPPRRVTPTAATALRSHRTPLTIPSAAVLVTASVVSCPCPSFVSLLYCPALRGTVDPSRFVPTTAFPCTAPSRTMRVIWDSGNLVLTYMERFSSATNLFGFLRLLEVVVE